MDELHIVLGESSKEELNAKLNAQIKDMSGSVIATFSIPKKWAEIIRHTHSTMELGYKIPNEKQP